MATVEWVENFIETFYKGNPPLPECPSILNAGPVVSSFYPVGYSLVHLMIGDTITFHNSEEDEEQMGKITNVRFLWDKKHEYAAGVNKGISIEVLIVKDRARKIHGRLLLWDKVQAIISADQKGCIRNVLERNPMSANALIKILHKGWTADIFGQNCTISIGAPGPRGMSSFVFLCMHYL